MDIQSNSLHSVIHSKNEWHCSLRAPIRFLVVDSAEPKITQTAARAQHSQPVIGHMYTTVTYCWAWHQLGFMWSMRVWYNYTTMERLKNWSSQFRVTKGTYTGVRNWAWTPTSMQHQQPTTTPGQNFWGYQVFKSQFGLWVLSCFNWYTPHCVLMVHHWLL